MKHLLVPFAGTGRFRTSFRAMRNRLLLCLLGRLFSYAQNYSFWPSCSLPLHFLMTGTDATVSPYGHYPSFLFQTFWIDLPSQDFSSDISRCQWYDQQETVFEGNTLTGFPFWRNN